MTLQLRTFGELDCVVTGEGDGPLVVLLHGFGAPGDDLVGLAGPVQAPRGSTFVFPEAPIDLGFGRAWWMVDLSRPDRDWDRLPAELPAAHAKALACLDAAQAALGRDRPLFLGGFSQGAMLACELAVHDARPLAGLALMSGTLLTPARWAPRFPERAGLPCLLSHGTEDPVLPFARAERWRDLLIAAGWKVDFRRFRGGHGIPGDVLAGLGQLLRG
jgi:phospholipase/carboxylesterase